MTSSLSRRTGSQRRSLDLRIAVGTLVLIQALVTTAAYAESAVSPASWLLAQGKNQYRTAHYADASQTLRSALSSYLGPEARRRYIDEAVLPELGAIEETLVYLALSHSKLGEDAQARDTIIRLLDAERIAPTYASLKNIPEIAEFETLAHRLVKGANLPHDNPGALKNASLPATAAVARTAAERALMARLIDERSTELRAELERQATARVAEEKAARNATAPTKVAALNRQSGESRRHLQPPAVMMPAEVISDPPAESDAPSVTPIEQEAPASVTVPTSTNAKKTAPVHGQSLRAHYDEMASAFASESKSGVTLQLAIVCETTSLTTAIHAGGENVWFVPFPYRGRSCYRVFWGHYASEESARRAAAEVPAALRGTSHPVVVHEPVTTR